jgi:hypothetical protein
MNKQQQVDQAYQKGFKVGSRDRRYGRKQRGLWLAIQMEPHLTRAFYDGYRAAHEEAIQPRLV